MEAFAAVLVAGLTIGSVYALIGLGFAAIYNSSGVINFANGDFAMLGGFFAYLLITTLHLPYWVGMLVVVALLALVGLLLQYGLINPLMLRRSSVVTIIIATLGASMIFGGAVGSATGYSYLRVDSPFPLEVLTIGPFNIMEHNALIIVVTIGIALLYWLFLKRTIWGKALEAVKFSRETARLIGIPATGLVSLTFAISAGMGGIAGVLIAPLVTVDAHMGLPLVINGFIAAIVGGLGNPMGALLGGFVVGLINVMITRYISSAYAMTLTFVVLLVILMFRPSGLLGERT